MMKYCLCINNADQKNTNISESQASPFLRVTNEEIQGDNRREHNTADDTDLSLGVYKTFDFYLINL